MQTAMRIQSAARNFPCCNRYVLHVSQMMWETSPMRLVDRQRAGAVVFQNAERRADGADDQAQEQNRLAADRAVEKFYLVERGQLDVRVAGKSSRGGKSPTKLRT